MEFLFLVLSLASDIFESSVVGLVSVPLRFLLKRRTSPEPPVNFLFLLSKFFSPKRILPPSPR